MKETDIGYMDCFIEVDKDIGGEKKKKRDMPP